MPRTSRIIVPEYPHHIIQRGNNRQKVFLDNQDYKKYLRLLSLFSNSCLCKIYAYCLMPNHTHLLLEPERPVSLSKLMQKVALCYTQYFNHKYGHTGRLWECHYHSSLVDKDNYMFAVISYIESNPIRAKSIESIKDYQWSSARKRFTGKDANELTMQEYFDNDLVNRYKNNFSIYDNAGLKDIDQRTRSGKPIGDTNFLKSIGQLIKKDILPRPRLRGKNEQ